MKERTVYWLPRRGGWVLISMAFMLCSALARVVWACTEGPLSAGTVWLHVILPLAANLSFAVILLRDGQDRLFRTAIPVWLSCIFFAVKALDFPSPTHTLACLALYAAVAVLFTLTVTGRIPTAVPIALVFGGAMAYHIGVEDRQKAGWPLHDWLPEVSVLCILAALLCLCFAMRRRPADSETVVRRFGDRNDGVRLRTLSPIFAVSPYIMRGRNESQNFIEDHIEVTEMDRYIAQKRKEGWKGFGTLHVVLAAYLRICARYPGLNRFIAGQKIYSRGREIEVNMTVKREMAAESPDSVIKVTLSPGDTAESAYRKFNEKVRQIKDSPEDTSFDALAGMFNLVPGLALSVLVGLLKILDYFGLLPRFLTRLSPFHGTIYVTSMASLGIPPIYHHLYDFGNVPVFCSIGQKRRVYETQRDGSTLLRKYIDCNFVTDERIVDGFYFASAMRYLHSLLEDPWQLDAPPEEIVPDQG